MCPAHWTHAVKYGQRHKSENKVWQSSLGAELAQKKTLQQEAHDNVLRILYVTEAHYSPRSVVMVSYI